MKIIGLIIVVALSFGTQAFGWGPVGHEIVASVGSELAAENSGSRFWTVNDKNMRLITNVPDRVWKKPETKPLEAPTHWFQVDAYVPSLNPTQILKFPKSFQQAVKQFGDEVVEINGFSPWRVVQFYSDSVAALKKRDFKSAIEIAGVMSHYIGDNAQPLHVTVNHDGQLSGNKGIHAWFETQNIGPEGGVRQAVLEKSRELLKNPAFRNELQGDLMDVLLKQVARSVALRDAVLINDTKFGRASVEGKRIQFELAVQRMADGSVTLAEILRRIWRDSGVSSEVQAVLATDPAWIPLDFSGGTPRDFQASQSIHFVR